MEISSRGISQRVFEEVWNAKKLDVVDELMAPEYVHHDSQSPPVGSIDAYKQLVAYYLNALPDLRFTLEREISEGDMVVTRWTATGTHSGDLTGLPRTGRRFSVSGMTMARTTNGKVIESWSNWDTLGMMQQLGGSVEAKGRAA